MFRQTRTARATKPSAHRWYVPAHALDGWCATFQRTFATVRRGLVRVATVAAIVALTVLAIRLFGPSPTQAQPAQQDEVRASSFVLVGPDGTVLGRLAPGPTGNGLLTLFDSAGRRRILMGAAGIVSIFDTDDKARVQLAFNPDPAAGGLLLFNDENQAVRLSLASNSVTGAGGLGIRDANNKPRIALGTFDGADFGLIVRDAEGNIIGTAMPR
jgi:preprotein translocase subunit Sec61beta